MGLKERNQKPYIFSIFVLICIYSLKSCYAITNITSSQPLPKNQTLNSVNQVFELGFFSLNNSEYQFIGIWYMQNSPRQIVWVANRENPISLADSNASLVINGSNGNLELLDGNNGLIWSTRVEIIKSNGSIAVLENNGNLILRDRESGAQLWQSFDDLSDTLLPGSAVGFNTKTGENYSITSWKTENDPSLGMFTAGLSPKKPPEAFIWINGSINYWRSGPWDKSKFSGIPTMGTFFRSSFDIEEDVEKGTTLMYGNWYNESTLANMYISPEGLIKTRLKDKAGGDWYSISTSPGINKCDAYGFCGPNGICKQSSPTCECLKGFVPKSKEDWSLENWSRGCVRQQELLSCNASNSSLGDKEGKNDRFWKIGNAKVPDFYELVELGYSGSDDSCNSWCMNNCSCLAYAFVSGIGCLVWSVDLIDIQVFPSGGADIFIRLAHEELVGEQGHKKIIVSLIIVIFTIVTIGAMVFGFRRWRLRQSGNVKDVQELIDSTWKEQTPRDSNRFSIEDDSYLHPLFDFETISVATDCFSLTNKLGQGGFGPVYKGKLQDGKEIAVKRLSSSSGQGSEEFKNEMILISKLQHRNLVKLFGYCIEKDEKLLVYEFMPNKSLDCFIFDPTRRTQLQWETRFNIIQGVAKGLVYLHRDSSLRVIHRDLKVSNILLDEKMNPKISDFGLARIFQGTLDLANTQRVVGTLGYMSPEYAMGGIFSEKSDVFSFGVLMLEILSGQKNTNFRYCDQQWSLIAYAWKLWSENRELDMIDDQLNHSYCATEAIRCMHVALLCSQDQASDRPSMPDVIFMLCNETTRPRPKQPMLTLQTPPTLFNTQSEGDSLFSVNQVTISMIEGR